jgi:hypothetical protein
MSTQTGLKLPPQQQASGDAQEAQEADTGAGTGAGAANNTRKSGRPGNPNGVIEMQLQSNCSANGA